MSLLISNSNAYCRQQLTAARHTRCWTTPACELFTND